MAGYPGPGDAFGAYDLVRQIGRGGMGVVYAAVHRGLKREVALKLLSHELSSAEEYQRRFAREAEVLARLESPHVITVYDAGEHDGIFYIATQLVPDGDLGVLIGARGVLPAELALDVTAQVCDGLAAAHDAGILHRDIKPSNVLLRESGGAVQALLCDLGISVALDSEHTKTSGVMGTLGYMAPERHEGAPASVASDVYAVGCLLWAMVAGRAPYSGTDLRVAMSHISDPVPQLNPRTPADLRVNEIVLRAMAKDPAARYASARDVLAAARAPLGTTVPAPTSAPRVPPPTVPPTPPTIARTTPPSGLPLPPTQRPSHPPVQPTRPPAPPWATPVQPASRAPRRTRLVVGAAVLALVAVVTSVVLVVTGGDDEPTADPTSTGPTRETASGPSEPTTSEPTGSTEPVEPTGDVDQEVVRADSSRFDGPAADLPGAEPGRTITVASAGPPVDDLDPTNAYGTVGQAILSSLVTRSLTQFARNPVTGGMELVPDLATDLGTPNADYTEWTFTLRDGVRWEDGRDVTAEELAFGISRSLDLESFPFGPGPGYSTRYFADGGDYDGPYTSGVPYDGIEVDGRTITISMDRPFAEMDLYGTLPAMGPAPLGDAARPPAYGRQPLATGPYRVASFEPGARIELVRNEEWDPATDPGRHAYPDAFDFTFPTDPSSITADVLSGAADLGLGLLPGDYEQLSEGLGTDDLVSQPLPCTSYVVPDWEATGGDTDDGRKIRLAMSLGYDAAGAAAAAGQVPEVTRIATGSVLPTGTIGRSERTVLPFDPDRAKELLAEAGHGRRNKFPLTMAYQRGTDEPAQDALTAGYEAAGFDVTALPYDGSLSLAYVEDDARALNDRLTLRRLGWCTDFASPSVVLEPLLAADASYNTGGFTLPGFDDRLAEVPLLPLDEQAAAWADLDDEVYAQGALLPVAQQATLTGMARYVGGYTSDVTSGYPAFEELYVEQ